MDRGFYLKVQQRRIFFDATGWLDVGERVREPQSVVGEVDRELLLAVS